MEWLQSLINSETTPVLTAFLLGLLTAISPCPLATNIAAIGYICNDTKQSRNILKNGLLYCLGRMFAYTILAVVLVSILKSGMSMFGLQKFVSTWGEKLLGPALVIMGLLMLFGNRLNLPSFGFKGNAESLKNRGAWGALLLGVLFAMAFCPTSGMFYFGMLIPMATATTAGSLLAVVFALATALPVLIVAWLLAFSINSLGKFYGKMKTIERWTSVIVGTLFVLIGLYECYIVYL
ncbi:MAG: aromatic aminobenezylarsenical efflux permease ArsG family transporter [Candidatus Onthomorpha sp.]